MNRHREARSNTWSKTAGIWSKNWRTDCRFTRSFGGEGMGASKTALMDSAVNPINPQLPDYREDTQLIHVREFRFKSILTTIWAQDAEAPYFWQDGINDSISEAKIHQAVLCLHLEDLNPLSANYWPAQVMQRIYLRITREFFWDTCFFVWTNLNTCIKFCRTTHKDTEILFLQ